MYMCTGCMLYVNALYMVTVSIHVIMCEILCIMHLLNILVCFDAIINLLIVDM